MFSEDLLLRKSSPAVRGTACEWAVAEGDMRTAPLLSLGVEDITEAWEGERPYS